MRLNCSDQGARSGAQAFDIVWVAGILERNTMMRIANNDALIKNDIHFFGAKGGQMIENSIACVEHKTQHPKETAMPLGAFSFASFADATHNG